MRKLAIVRKLKPREYRRLKRSWTNTPPADRPALRRQYLEEIETNRGITNVRAAPIPK
jgi:hypothetical protein